jgi:4-aminobutyrate aminotransferase-like enzyme/Ser/Thr protein kinase RdoA (MazF antagonist)
MSRAPGVLEAKAPVLTATDAARVADEVFGLRRATAADPLDSERDQNFRLDTSERGEFVLKIANAAEDPAVLDLQNRALQHVAQRDPELEVPRLVLTPGGETSALVTGPDGRRHLARVLTFLPGRTLGEVPHKPELLRSLGTTLARLGRALRGFFHPAAGHELLWDFKHAARLRVHLDEIRDPARRAWAAGCLDRFETRVAPVLPDLRAQVIHNDVSLHNTLVDSEGVRVAGIIDFGDLVHAPLVNDLAVTVTEVMLAAPDPIAAAAAVVNAFDRGEALRYEERALLFDLVATRLAMAVLISAWRVSRHPENREYITGDDAASWSLIEHLAEIEPALRGAFLGAAPAAAGTDSVERLIARRARRLGPALTHFYERPLHMVRGRGAWLTDADGHAYLDAYNNVPHVGHAHPAVADAIARQTATLNTNTRYLYESVVDYADRLVESLPDGLDVCMFVCSGSEANDLAWRIAKAHTRHRGAIVVEGAYHGSTDAVNDLSPSELRAGAAPARHVRVVPAPDDYRGAYRRGEERVAERYAEHLPEAIASLRANAFAPAAFFLDTLLSSSGILIAPDGYLRAAFGTVRAAGGLCVADEVQAGFGRTGDHLWGFEAHGVVPDIVTLGKPIGNGYPLAAVVTTQEIAASFAEEGEFFSTFGGNPVACAAGLAVLEVMERERLRENASRVGAQLRKGVEALAASQPLIGDVRGRGLYVGVDLVRDPSTREPATREARRVMEGMRERRVLVGVDGPHANVLKIRPPLVFSAKDADRLLEALDASLAST